MRIAIVSMALVALCSFAGCMTRSPQPAAQIPATAPEDYRLGVGDVISIRVYGGEEDLTFGRIRLNDRGSLTLPFGDFTAFGRTTRELENEITGTLKGQYLLKPRVWVNVEDYRPFFMQGQVARPGAFPYQPGMTVDRAITIAGGFRDRAAKDKVFLVRDGDKEQKKIPISRASPIGPGDTIIVEESFF